DRAAPGVQDLAGRAIRPMRQAAAAVAVAVTVAVTGERYVDICPAAVCACCEAADGAGVAGGSKYTVLVCVKNCAAALPCSRENELDSFIPPKGTCGSAPAVSPLMWTTPASTSHAKRKLLAMSRVKSEAL